MINLLKKFEQLDNKKIILIVAALFIIGFLDLSFLMKFQLEGIKNLQPKIIKLKENLDRLAKDLDKMQDFKNKQTETEKKGIAKAKKIISEEEVVSLLQNVSSIANKNDIQITQMKPSKESQALKQEKSIDLTKFSPLLINLDLSCDYHRLGKFITDLENGEIYISVQNMKITSQQPDYLRQKVNLVLKTYVRK